MKVVQYQRDFSLPAGKQIGFVPTMGALHEGHLSLMERSKKENDFTVLSIFVNPKQFGPEEDLGKYPRSIDQDLEYARKCGIDLVYVPSAADIYPDEFSTYVEETELSRRLCGAFRPGHFRGVCTVVLKLLMLIHPTRMYLGYKDAQQLRVIQKMVEDYLLPVRVVACDTVREPDGLAKSSRNVYLTGEEREIAPILYRSLQHARKTFDSGERDSAILINKVRERTNESSHLRIQYIELVDWKNFKAVKKINNESLLAIAAFLGKTRLIDNVVLTP